MRYMIICNGDPRQVWNWEWRRFALDIDKDYSGVGWSYTTLARAKRRQIVLRAVWPRDDIDIITWTQHQRMLGLETE